MEVEAWLARAAATQPERAALETSAGDWSYARLHDAARFAAGELIERGAGRGTRVAIALPAGLEFAQALHACLLLGAVAVPVDLRLAPAERERIAAGADVRVEQPLGEGPVPASLPGVGTHELDATAVVIHTSGTTSTPRPVELTYGNLLWSAFGSAVALGLDRRRALAVRAAAVACRRAVDPACARRSTRPAPSCTSASRRTACCTRSRSSA